MYVCAGLCALVPCNCDTFIHMFFRNGSVGGCVGDWVLGVFGSVGGGVVCFELLSRVAFVIEHVFVWVDHCFFACKSSEVGFCG